MSRPLHEPIAPPKRGGHAVLELTVNNHPGVMAHVCGLFSRRAYNVEGILCLPLPDGRHSRIWMRVAEDDRLQQVISQTQKLQDVLEVRRHSADEAIFDRLAALVRA